MANVFAFFLIGYFFCIAFGEGNLFKDRNAPKFSQNDATKKIAFFVRGNAGFDKSDSIIPYQIDEFNYGNALNKTSGTFHVPVKGIYHFFFSAMNTKKEFSGKSSLTVQLKQVGNPDKVIAESHINTNDWYGWFPVHLEATVHLELNSIIGVQLLLGTIFESSKTNHLLTIFGGFLVSQDDSFVDSSLLDRNAPKFSQNDATKKIAFFVRGNAGFNKSDSIIPYQIDELNYGNALNKTSGTFHVPVKGIYHFFFSAMKMKKEFSGTSSLTVQLKQVGNPDKVIAESHINSNDWYGWFPVHLKATIHLELNSIVGVQLLLGTIFESSETDHLLTSFGGFLVSQDNSLVDSSLLDRNAPKFSQNDATKKIAFFVRGNAGFDKSDSIIPYQIDELNYGNALNKTSGTFHVPVKGIYHFFFSAMKMKKEFSGTSSLTVQLKQVGNPDKVIAESHINSNDWYGWFPVHLEATVHLELNSIIGVQLLLGTIFESNETNHLLTSFGGFLVSQDNTPSLRIFEKDLAAKESRNPAQPTQKTAERTAIAFLAERNSSCHHLIATVYVSYQNWEQVNISKIHHAATIVAPYQKNPLNKGQCFDPNSGVFKAPFNGIFYFYFTGLKMKKRDSSTSRITTQILSRRKNNEKTFVLAESHMNSVDLDGWFPFLLQITANLQTDEEIFVCLLDGSIYESGSFGGFLLHRL